MSNINKHRKTKYKPRCKFKNTVHLCVCIIVHNCHTQYSTKAIIIIIIIFLPITSKQMLAGKDCVAELRALSSALYLSLR